MGFSVWKVRTIFLKFVHMIMIFSQPSNVCFVLVSNFNVKFILFTDFITEAEFALLLLVL